MHSFDYSELFVKFRYPLLILLVGGVLITSGIFYSKYAESSRPEVEVLGESINENIKQEELTVEISGEVLKPGVYKLTSGTRINELIMLSGGLTDNADNEWLNKYLNKAAKLADGQKVFIPAIKQNKEPSANSDEVHQSISTSDTSNIDDLININTASLSQLDTLPGIGQTYGQKMIEHRPYSTTEELVSKGVIKQNLFNKIKDLITIY